MKTTLRFNATVSDAVLTLPKSVNAKLPSSSGVAMEGIINGLPFQAVFEPDGKGSRRLKLNRIMNNAAIVSVDNQLAVPVEITRIGDETDTRIPADLLKAIKATPKAFATWGTVTPLARRDWIFWFISAKQEETRLRHIKKACDMLSHGKKRVCCFGGVTWLMKYHPSAKGRSSSKH